MRRTYIHVIRVSDFHTRHLPHMKSKSVRYGEDPNKAEGMTLGGAINALQAKGACIMENWPFDLS